MDNQHEKITGYRDLSQEEIDLMNEVKAQAEATRMLILKLDSMTGPDGRWVSIARTQLQQGFMALVRSIAKPTTF